MATFDPQAVYIGPYRVARLSNGSAVVYWVGKGTEYHGGRERTTAVREFQTFEAARKWAWKQTGF